MFKHPLRITLFWLCLAISSALQAAPDGQKLYIKHCSVCHNDNGMGGIGLPLNSEKIEHFPRDYLFNTIRNGRPGRVMPAFSKLSDAQVNAIVDHVLSWKKTKQHDIYSPLAVVGDPKKGKSLFEEKCASCHGMNGKSKGIGTGVTLSRERKFAVVPPALNNAGFLTSASDEWIKSTIKHGRPGTIMPSQKILKLSDQQLDDVVSYVRSFGQEYNDETSDEAEDPTIVVDSPYDFNTTVSNIKQSMEGLNFRYFPDRYLEMGLADDAVINKKQLSLRFCNFKRLYKMINIEPRLGVVLPCRLTVVEEDDGSVKIYAMNMKLVSRLFNNTQLIEAAGQMHKDILEIIDEATL
jgi:cytochrome c oxidase cbb3-type subunit III